MPYSFLFRYSLYNIIVSFISDLNMIWLARKKKDMYIFIICFVMI